MLVLTRQLEEVVMIGEDIEVNVLSIRGNKVRLGISAPANVQVHRKEVYEAIQRKKEPTQKTVENWCCQRPHYRKGSV